MPWLSIMLFEAFPNVGVFCWCLFFFFFNNCSVYKPTKLYVKSHGE